jgi:hypothetical protein
VLLSMYELMSVKACPNNVFLYLFTAFNALTSEVSFNFS